jgi:predicted ATPase/class 3 adenylate cyclase
MGVFLFTDIEGSTALWADHPEEMGAALARHDELLFGAVGDSGGEVFKHTGDGLAAVFPSVSMAVQAAARAQRGLAAQDWGSVGALRVRMAIHAGEAEPRGGDWFGPALNRTARLMGIGHGGQVLLSDAAYVLVPDELRDQFSFVEMGAHRLRDLSRPERVWQLAGAGLERRFPPLRSFDGSRGVLPVQTTSFIGRQAELDQLAGELGTARLVTLVGPGGVGKTRLAVQAGANLMDKFSDGVWMFELAGLNHPDGLEASMLATLGRSGTSVTDPRQELLDMVSRWRALLVVDNCEHLLRPVAALVRDLLAAGPDLQVLATSREALHLPGEQVTVVDPLPAADDAVALFVDRATSARRSFVAEGENRAAVERICQQLDGMPLAIELAAARISAMSPPEIERRLDRRFRLLSERSGDQGRHSSLEKVVDWSYHLLSADLQHLFLRLSVFSGHFDSEAAHAVCGGDDELATLDGLTDLVDRSMVVATPLGARTSYWLLETMRQFGAARLAEPERKELLDRHSEYFADLAERSWGGTRSRQRAAWLELIDDEFDNIRAAFARALLDQNVDRAVQISGGLFMYNHTRRLPEIYRWLDQALALPDADQHRMIRHARLHHAYGNFMASEFRQAELETRSVLDAGDDIDTLRPLALFQLAATGDANDPDEFVRLSRESYEAARLGGSDYDYDRTEALWNLCIDAMNQGRPDPVLAHELLDLGRDLGNARALAGGLMTSAVAEDDLPRAIELLDEARDVTARSRDTFRYAAATAWLGFLTAGDDPQAALRTVPDLVAHAQATGQHILLKNISRDLLMPLATLQNFEAVAILDGAGNDVSIRPARAAEAVATAKRALDDQHYEMLHSQGEALSPIQLEDYLLGLADKLT